MAELHLVRQLSQSFRVDIQVLQITLCLNAAIGRRRQKMKIVKEVLSLKSHLKMLKLEWWEEGGISEANKLRRRFDTREKGYRLIRI